MPLTPGILLALDRLDPNKGKQARLLTEHLTGQRTLQGTEQELQKLLERKVEKKIMRQQAATEAVANKTVDEQMEAHEVARAAHLA